MLKTIVYFMGFCQSSGKKEVMPLRVGIQNGKLFLIKKRLFFSNLYRNLKARNPVAV